MAVSQEDVSRAACILRELLLLSSDDSDKDMRPLEAAIDTLLSPLFRSLVDICNKNKEMMSNIDSNNPIDHAFDFTSINSAPSSKSNTTTGSSSQRELHQIFRDKYEINKPRVVTLIKEHRSLGLEIAGLSRTGLYISELVAGGTAERYGLLQVGDRVIKVDERDCSSMASFEVHHYIEEILVNETVKLEVQYDPTGLMDFLNTHRR